MTDRRGFTLVELIIVVLIVSILAAIAQPKLSDVLVKARAAEAYADMEVVRVAAHEFWANNDGWPPEASQGVVPTGLDAYLPANFSLSKEGYELDFDNWGGSPFEAGITLITTDASFGLNLLNILPPPKWSAGNKYSWVIE